MPIDSSIPMGIQLPTIPDQGNQLLKILQVKGLQDESALNAIKTQATQRDFDRQNRLDQLLQSGDVDSTALRRGGFLKESLDMDKSTAETGLQKANTSKAQEDAAKAHMETAHQQIDTIGQVAGWLQQSPTPQNATLALQHLQTTGVITPQVAQQYDAQFKADPTPEGITRIASMAAQSALDMKEQLPKLQTNNIGGATVTQAVNPVTGQVKTVSTLQNTQSPDSVATIAGEDRRAGNTIAKDYAVAGLNPDGTPGGDVETTARAIASGQLPPPSGMALTNPKNQRILSRVMEINPDYDYTTVTAKKTAAAAFTSGAQGNQLRSFQVAGQHLDQLGQLIDALGNNDTQAINRIGNFISQQTGSPVVTNFDAAKDVVSKEVMKAIVAGGGGEGERTALKNSLDAAKSTAQLKGVVQQYRNLMDAQSGALLDQRRAAGLPDSTLPKYGAPSGGPAPARVTNASDYANVPKGAQYIAPDGTTRTKQ